MSAAADNAVTKLLQRWQATSSDRNAVAENLLPAVYRELRSRAAMYLRRERANHTLQPTALVHEAYMKLADQNEARWQNRGHFFAVAAQAMRRILVDHARTRRRIKRGGPVAPTSLEGIDVAGADAPDLVDIDRALDELEQFDPRQARVVELRYFAGLTVEETAEAMDLSPATVKREWTIARAWLHARLEGKNT
jgi:RNA polymerase sigma-70 factor, ECF subfamily